MAKKKFEIQLTSSVWPKLPEATGDLGILIRRWLKDGDWSAAGKVIDMLQDCGRVSDAIRVKEEIARRFLLKEHAMWFPSAVPASPDADANLFPASVSDLWFLNVMRILWWDLFDFNSSISVIIKNRTDAKNEYESAKKEAYYAEHPEQRPSIFPGDPGSVGGV